MQSLRDPSKRLETLNKMHESLPLGTNSWLVVTDEGVCKMRIGQVLNLTLTTCFPNKFTCDDGQCTDLRSVVIILKPVTCKGSQIISCSVR